MCRTQCVLALLALYVGLAHSFSWDEYNNVVVSNHNRLNFYDMHGTLTQSRAIPSGYISLITYDPAHDRVLFLRHDGMVSVSSFDISTKEFQTLVRSPSRYIESLAYDPVTELLYWVETEDIHSLLLQPGSSKENILIRTYYRKALDIAVDSCRGFVYWISDKISIERAPMNSSNSETLIDDHWLHGLTIDQQTKKMYWIVLPYYPDHRKCLIKSADLNGKNIETLYEFEPKQYFSMLSVSNEFIYLGGYPSGSFWQLPKKPPGGVVHPKLILNKSYMDIATNYKNEDPNQGIQNCEALKSVQPINSDYDSLNVSTDANLLCVHGTKVSGKSVCECAQGYTGERCDVLVCQNYCFRGNCSVSAEGQPKCRCNAGYSGERCEVGVCQGFCLHNGVCSLNKTSEPVCQCTGGYGGKRCEVFVCQNYCFQGECSISAEEHPKCRCNDGYSGDRCEIKGCQNYCLNNGICSIQEKSERVCQCTGDYEGDRCDVPVFLTKCFRTVSLLKDILNTDVTPITLGQGVEPSCTSTVA